ncbi:hypothetical protein AK812_SmicGene43496 [Symbiodinium microadriaticum]|uniref:Uncharacterized protein n=1 Tax=Symbiodinium microadriaticum TaxID=2951 RepID=A0A1Q9C0V6_SYMMI|nr:hypothetical protein AK812_SmicGene43496 [Symbiodinium microadriaticum]
MAKTVALIRHGHSQHNPRDGAFMGGFAWLSNLFQRDTSLTDEGLAQAVAVNESLSDRAQQFDPRIQRGCICPLHTERCVFPCDTGRSPEALAEEFPSVRRFPGFEELEEQWWPKDRSIMSELHPNDRAGAPSILGFQPAF